MSNLRHGPEYPRARAGMYSILTRKFGSGSFGEISAVADRLAAIGVSLLHISPVYPQSCDRFNGTDNDHGYWPSDHREVDAALGGLEGLMALRDVCARHGIELALDIVLTHFGYGGDKGAAAHLHKLDSAACYRKNINVPQEIYTALDEATDSASIVKWRKAILKYTAYNLPFFDHARADIGNYIIEAHLKFARLGFSAFRIDSCRHISTEFLVEFLLAMAEAANGRPLTFFLEEAGFNYTSIMSRYYELKGRIDGALTLRFYDFPLSQALLALQAEEGSFRDFMQFMHRREAPAIALETLVPFVESHDSTDLVKSSFWGIALHAMARFFSKLPPMLYHGGECAAPRPAARSRISTIEIEGEVASFVSKLGASMAPYLASETFYDTKEYLADGDTLLVGKYSHGRRIFLLVHKGRNREVTLDLSDIVYAPRLEIVAVHGGRVSVECVDQHLRIRLHEKDCMVFEIIGEQISLQNPPRPRLHDRELVSTASPSTEKWRVLMAAMEFGQIPGLLNLDGGVAEARAGGLGQVIGELVREYPIYLRNCGGDCFFAFPLYGGIDRRQLQPFASLRVALDQRDEEVGIWRYVLVDGTQIFFISHDLISRKTIATSVSENHIYKVWSIVEEMKFLRIFNEGLAHLHAVIGANIYHGHDYQASLAPLYMKNLSKSVISIHNADLGYSSFISLSQYWTRPAGHVVSNKEDATIEDFARIMKVGLASAVEWFQHKGQINVLKGMLRLLGRHNAVAGIPVSERYAVELKKSWASVVEEIKDFHGREPLEWSNVFVPNGNIFHPNLRGVDSGSVFRDPDVDHLNWSELKAEKHRAKRKLALSLFGAGDDDRPMCAVISRLTVQKNVKVLIGTVKSILDQGGAVVLAGPADSGVEATVGQLRELRAKYSDRLFWFDTFVSQTVRRDIQMAADFTLIPSRYEPFGLTDIEFSRYGVLIIARNTGGLGKVPGGIYYDWMDTTDTIGETAHLSGIVSEVIHNFQDRPDMYETRLRMAREKRFPWSVAFDQYTDIYRANLASHDL